MNQIPNAIYSCSTARGVVKIRAHTSNSVNEIKAKAAQKHGVSIIDVVAESRLMAESEDE